MLAKTNLFRWIILCLIAICYSPSLNLLAQTTAVLDTVWLNYYGGKRADGIHKIIETYDGKIVGVGHSKSNEDFIKEGKKKKSKEGFSKGGNDDIFFLQINKDGKEEYITVFGKKGKEVAYSVIQTFDGGFVIVGYTDADYEGVLGAKDAWIIKLDENKKHLWNKRFGSPADDAFLDVAQMRNGNLVACGYKANMAYTVSLDWQGNMLAEETYLGAYHKEIASRIINLDDGNLALGGIASKGSKAASFFRKINSNLLTLGQAEYYFNRLEGHQGLGKVDVLELPNGNILLSSPADPENDAILVGLIMLNSTGSRAKRADGSPFIYHFPQENSSYAFSMLQACDDQIYVTGASKAHNRGGSANKNKFFLTSINTDLDQPREEFVFYGGNFEDRAYSMIQYHDGSLYVAGASNSENAYWGGGENACIVKTSPLSFTEAANKTTLEWKKISLVDTSADELLEAEERAYIRVELQNRSNTTIHDFKAKIRATTDLIDYPSSMFLGSFPANSTKVVGIPVKGKKRLVDGTHDFTINFEGHQAVDIAPINFSIDSRKPSKSDLQIVASNFEKQKNIVPEQEVTLKVTLTNKGDKAAEHVTGFFNFEGGNVSVLSPRRIPVGIIAPDESKEFEITFKTARIDRGQIVKAKFTYSSDTQLAYDVQEEYPYQVAIDIPMPSLVIAAEEWSADVNNLPRGQELSLQLKVTNEGEESAKKPMIQFEASEGIQFIGETTIKKDLLIVGGNWVVIYKFKIPMALEAKRGEIKMTLSSEETSDKALTFPVIFENIEPPNLVLVDQEIIAKDNVLMPGGKATLQLTIQNKGAIAAENTSFMFVVNKGLAAESDSKRLLSSIPANTTETVSFDFAVLADFTEDSASIGITVLSDQPNLQQDIPTTIPIMISPLPQKKPALLAAQYVLESPDNAVMKGTSAIFKVNIQNKGELPATGVRVQLGLERGLTLRSEKVDVLDVIEAGASKEATFQFSVPEEFKGSEALLTSTFYAKEKPYIGGKKYQYTAKIIPPKDRPQPDYDVVMMWRYPGEAEWTTDTVHQQIQLQASSKLPLEKEDFRIYLNNVWINQPGSKFGKVSISQADKFNGRYDFKLDASVTLDKQIKKNVIQVKVFKGKQTYTSKTRTLFYEREPVNLHFVGIGISKYTELNGPDDLQFASKDVEDVASIFKEQEGNLFSKIHCHLLSNEKQTRRNDIISTLDDLADESYRRKINKNDVLIFYVSSHGLAKGSEFKIMPSDYQNKKNDNAFLLDFEADILYRLKRTGIKNIFVFIDACHSGAIGDINVDNFAHSKAGENPFIAQILHNLLNEKLGIVPIVSCQAGELSWEHPDWENGAFTEAFKEAFENQEVPVKGGQKTTANGNVGDKKLSFTELFHFLQLRVPYIVQEKKKTTQTPYIPKPILDDLREKEKASPGSMDMFIVK